MAKKFNANYYSQKRIKSINHELTIVSNSDYLYSDGIYPTKIKEEDLPEWYFRYCYYYSRYLSAKGVKDMVLKCNYMFTNHLHKDDILYISYNNKIEEYQNDYGKTYRNYDRILSGNWIIEYIQMVKKYSNYDITELEQELERKRAWYEINKDR